MIRRLLAISGAVAADAVRHRVVLVVVVFAGLLTLAIPSLPSYGIGVVEAVYREVALALSYLTALVLTLILAANRIPGEVERRTAYPVVTRPVGRWEYLAGTWLGIAVVVAGSIAAFTLVEQAWAIIKYASPMWVLWEGALGIWLEMSVIAAFCVVVSSLIGPAVSTVASLAFVLIGHTRDSVIGTGASAVVRALYPSLDMFNIVDPVAHGAGVSLGYAASMIVAFVGWAGLLLLIGSVLFARRDL
jgi:ABC-type transport system involved in multi-copper enzyme maturation permease subunit